MEVCLRIKLALLEKSWDVRLIANGLSSFSIRPYKDHPNPIAWGLVDFHF